MVKLEQSVFDGDFVAGIFGVGIGQRRRFGDRQHRGWAAIDGGAGDEDELPDVAGEGSDIAFALFHVAVAELADDIPFLFAQSVVLGVVVHVAGDAFDAGRQGHALMPRLKTVMSCPSGRWSRSRGKVHRYRRDKEF